MTESPFSEVFEETCKKDKISICEIISCGNFFVNIHGDLFMRMDEYTTDTWVIHSNDLVGDFHTSLKAHWRIAKCIYGNADKEDFCNAFVVAWYRARYTDKSQIPNKYNPRRIIWNSRIHTAENQSSLVDDDAPNLLAYAADDYLRFMYLADKSEIELMHHNGFLHLPLNEPFVQEGRTLNYVTSFFQVNIGTDKFNYSAYALLIFDKDYYTKEFRLVSRSAVKGGFSIFLLNFFANVYHKMFLDDPWDDDCDNFDYFKRHCFTKSHVFMDDDGCGRFFLNDVETPVKVIFEEYLTTLIPMMQHMVEQDISIDIFDYDGERWWFYVYEHELSMWNDVKETYFEIYFSDEICITITQYVVQFLNYMNFKYNLGKLKLDIPQHPSYFDDNDSEPAFEQALPICQKEEKTIATPEHFSKYFRSNLSDKQIEFIDKELKIACGKGGVAAANVLFNEDFRKNYLAVSDVPNTKLHASLVATYGLKVKIRAFSDAMSKHRK